MIKTDPLDGAAMRLRARAGLNPDPVGRVRLERLLAESALLAGVPVASYLDLVDTQPAAFGDLVDRVTVQHSAFFRDPGQFVAVSALVRISSSSSATIWCAGCGNGQEAYSLAMLLDEIGQSSWHVVASDISRKAITRTAAAVYTEAEVKGLSAERRKRYLLMVPGGYEIAPAIKRRVRVAQHNLAHADPPPPVPICAVVFCRNVLMYFGREEAQACIARLAERIPVGGHLFLGHSDTTGRIAGHFALTDVAGALCYRRLPAAARPTASEPQRSARLRPDPSALMAEGETAAEGGDLRMAIRAFRQAIYIDPNLPAAYFQLGAAFDLAGDTREARRAFAAAGLALMRGGDDAENVSRVEGYAARDLARAIATKLTGSGG